MKHRTFQRRDFEEYHSWFTDSLLQETLGPLDDEWLNCVLAEDPPSQFSFFVDDQFVAVAGISFPDQDNPYFVITDVAVQPGKRRLGFGAKAIQILQNIFIDPEFCQCPWLAYVELNNLGAQEFFTSLGWQRDAEVQDDMYCFRFAVAKDFDSTAQL